MWRAVIRVALALTLLEGIICFAAIAILPESHDDIKIGLLALLLAMFCITACMPFEKLKATNETPQELDDDILPKYTPRATDPPE